MEPCTCNRQSDVELQCKHVLCAFCAYSSVVAGGACPRCHVPISCVDQRGSNLICQLRNIRVNLLLEEGETIHSVIAHQFKIPRDALKIVSKGCVRTEEDAMKEWRTDPNQVFFVVGSAGEQKSGPMQEAKAAKARESLEKFKAWQSAEQKRLALSQHAFEAKQSQTFARRAELTMQRASAMVTSNSLAQNVLAVVQGVGLFFTTLISPFAADEEDIARARAVANDQAGNVRRGMGGIRRPETHSTGMAGGG